MKVYRLTRAIVADIPFSVLSPVVLANSGWTTELSGEHSRLRLAASRLQVTWWVEAYWKDFGSKGKPSKGSAPMDVNSHLKDESNSSSTSVSDVRVSVPVRSQVCQKGILKGSSTSTMARMDLNQTQKASGLSFMLRGFRSDLEFSDCIATETLSASTVSQHRHFDMLQSAEFASSLVATGSEGWRQGEVPDWISVGDSDGDQKMFHCQV